MLFRSAFIVAWLADQLPAPRAAMHLLDPAKRVQAAKIAADRLRRYIEPGCKHLDRHFPFSPDDRLDLRLSFVRLHHHPQTNRPSRAIQVNNFLDRMVKSCAARAGQLDGNDQVVNIC